MLAVVLIRPTNDLQQDVVVGGAVAVGAWVWASLSVGADEAFIG